VVCTLIVVFSVAKSTWKRTTAKDTSISETVKSFFRTSRRGTFEVSLTDRLCPRSITPVTISIDAGRPPKVALLIPEPTSDCPSPI
jgi:hypothetical protein